MNLWSAMISDVILNTSSTDLDDFETFDPCDIDREEFNPTLCLLKYRNDSNLQQLVMRKNHIDQQIQSLSANLQNLLYDNYQKFINATSVVTNMKNNFEKMENEMNLLQSKMINFKSTSSGILQKLRPQKENMAKLLRSQDCMKKLKLISDLILTLQHHIKLEEYELAIQHYLKVAKLLGKYQHLKSFQGIVKECDEIIVFLKTKLKERLHCFGVFSKDEIATTTNLILKVEKSAKECLGYLLSGAGSSLSALLCKLEEKLYHLENSSDDQGMKSGMNSKVTECMSASCDYVEQISKVMLVAKEVFLSTDLWNSSFCPLSQLEAFIAESADCLSVKIRTILRREFHNLEDEVLSSLLDNFYRICQTCSSIVPQVKFDLKFVEIILKICSDRCDFHQQRIRKSVRTFLRNLSGEVEKNNQFLNKHLIYLECHVESTLVETIRSLQQYIRPEFRFCREVNFRKTFCNTLVREGILVSFTRHVQVLIWNYISSLDANNDCSTAICAIFCKFLDDMHQTMIQNILSLVDDHWHADSDGCAVSSASKVSEECKVTTQKSINKYVQLRHQIIYLLIQKGVASKNWMNVSEPRHPRSVVKRVLDEIEASRYQIEPLFGSLEIPTSERGSDSGKAIFMKSPSRDGSPSKHNREAMELLSKIFCENGNYFEVKEFSTRCILTNLIGLSLKCFIEHIRMKTFNSFGLQQIQVDAHYLQTRVSLFLYYGNDVVYLFDDLVLSCEKRTFDPQFMKSSIVSWLCDNSFP